MSVSSEDILKVVKEEQIRLIRYLYCDPAGVIRGKTVTASQLPSKITEGVGLTKAQHAVNLFEDLVPIEGMEPVGEVRIIPDPETFTILPWVDKTAGMFCDLTEQDGSEWGGCTRSVLKRAIAKLGALGMDMKSAFESEFYLATLGSDGNPIPWRDGPVYSSSGMDRASSAMHDMVDNLQAQGIIVEQAINEYGPGQQEIAIKYGAALQSADTHLKFRDTIRGTAELQHGLLASLAPKPFKDGIGSGAHLHFSIWSKAGVNLFYNEVSPTKISKFGESFVAGILLHLPALLALTCPSVVSYQRLKPHSWAGNTISWGYDNRECAVRVASPFKGREMHSINLELKTCDGSANPYLALAGVILAGLDGVAQGLIAPMPAHRDPALLTESERIACGIKALPSNQLEALKYLENDSVLAAGLGPLLIRAILATRRAENAKAEELGEDWARAATFSTF
jgi:glutamine synthetase